MSDTLNKSREAEGRQTTSIRPKSLRRAQVITAHIKNENVTDFISNAVDAYARQSAKKHKIQLPADAAFDV